MNILILGGTGAMGTPIVNILAEQGYNIYVTSRSNFQSSGNVYYIKGNAKDINFLDSILTRHYDAIIDFMNYTTSEFKVRLSRLLDSTEQYFFLSSSRVYAESNDKITETSYRLLDVCKDKEYLDTDEYALAKAKEENILQESGYNNWTIIRPYITYNSRRLQLGVFEKEHWLYRALNGRTIIFPDEIACKKTTLTYGTDVAARIVKLIGQKQALGEIFHIVSAQTICWKEVLDIYLGILEKTTGTKTKILILKETSDLKSIWNYNQVKYDRLYNRCFDNSKINFVCGDMQYKEIHKGLSECLNDFLKNPKWLNINWKFEAWADRMANEYTPLNEIPGWKMKLKYLKWRYISL